MAAQPMLCAAEQGYIEGYPDGHFGVDDSEPRQQVVTVLGRWAGSPDVSGENYADEASAAAYAQTATDWSQSNHILAGRENSLFAPDDRATRAEVVSALYQYMIRPAERTPSRILVAYFLLPILLRTSRGISATF